MGLIEIVKILLDSGADINGRDKVNGVSGRDCFVTVCDC